MTTTGRSIENASIEDASIEDASIEDDVAEVFAAAGARGFLHAREVGVDDGPEVCLSADEPVVLASVFKIPVAVAYAREVVAGRLDETERTTVTARDRIGGIGTAGCADDVQMSWRDLAAFMLTMSDNAATDTIYRRVGRQAVENVCSDLKLTSTRLIGCCEDLFATMTDDLGVDVSDADAEATLARIDPQLMWSVAALDPARTSASTPREVTTLLDAIWTDRAAPPAACERVRDIMTRQIWPHRISAGFPSEVTLAAKTGTLPGIRNEAGVAGYPDGRRYAVAVFTRAGTLDERQPAIDRAIGTAAHLAVERLRAR
jgi:beta-lactamase class A